MGGEEGFKVRCKSGGLVLAGEDEIHLREGGTLRSGGACTEGGGEGLHGEGEVKEVKEEKE